MLHNKEYAADKEPRLKVPRMTMSAVGLAAAAGFGVAGLNHALWEGRYDHEADKYAASEAQIPSVDSLNEDASRENEIAYYDAEEVKDDYLGRADAQAAAKDGDLSWAVGSFTMAVVTSASIVVKKFEEM